MKKIKRLLALCLCGAMMLIMYGVTFHSSATQNIEFTDLGCYGFVYDNNKSCVIPYPVSRRFVNSIGSTKTDFITWYENEYCSYVDNNEDALQYLSNLWYYNYMIGDRDVITEEYLDRYNTLLSEDRLNEILNNNFSVDYASFIGNRLTVNCHAKFNVTYSYELDYSGSGYYYVSSGTHIVRMNIAVRSKNDGSLIHFGMVRGNDITPEYRYGYISSPVIATHEKEYYAPYVSEKELTFTVNLPKIYDAEKHSIELYFSYIPEHMISYMENPDFFSKCIVPDNGFGDAPLFGDSDNNGTLNLLDVTLMLKRIAEWDIEPGRGLDDADRDTYVTLKDVSYLLKRIAGWNV